MTPPPPSELPILVDRSEARAVLGVTESTFARLVREGRFRDATLAGPPLYHTRELLAHRARREQGKPRRNQSRRHRHRPKKSVTSAGHDPAKSPLGRGTGSGGARVPVRAAEESFGLAGPDTILVPRAARSGQSEHGAPRERQPLLLRRSAWGLGRSDAGGGARGIPARAGSSGAGCPGGAQALSPTKSQETTAQRSPVPPAPP
jgi:hypothetical protein